MPKKNISKTAEVDIKFVTSMDCKHQNQVAEGNALKCLDCDKPLN